MALLRSFIIRLLARVLLVPFPFQAPSVELGSLTKLLEDAPAAFPTLLQIGHKVINGDHDSIAMAQKVLLNQ